MDQATIEPTLVVDGADRAIEFYVAVFGATRKQRFAVDGRVVFASLRIGPRHLQLKDADAVDAAPPDVGGGVLLEVTCSDPDGLVARAVEHGAEVIFPVRDQPYGSRQGRFRDPFGHHWIVGTPLSMTDAEVQAALDAMS